MAAKKKKTPAKKAAPKRAATSAKKPLTKASGTKKASRPAAKPNKRVVRTSKRPPARPKRPAGRKKPAVTVPEAPKALALARDIAKVALEKKALDVLIIDTRARASAVGYDYVVLATGESDRQLGAIADALDEALKPRGHRPSSVEPAPDWVLVNYDDVVVHLFTPDKRGVYDLEGLWSDAPRVPLA
ncbi:MAG: ribosome silencing factor [Myxococcota bacterium]|jgi:ribosome-associated protein